MLLMGYDDREKEKPLEEQTRYNIDNKKCRICLNVFVPHKEMLLSLTYFVSILVSETINILMI